MKRLGLPLIAVLVASAFWVTATALAVAPPHRSVLVSLTSIDGNKINGKPAGFTTSVKATFITDNGDNTVGLQWETKKGDPSTMWANQSRDNAYENFSIAYYAPFHTAKGDRSGTTTLAQFLKHWPGGKVMVAYPFVGNYKSWNVVYMSKTVKTTFSFDKHKRLAGVALYATWGQPNSAEQYCYLPQCVGHD